MQNSKVKFKTDLIERAYDFGLKVIFLCDKLPQKRSSWVISDQIIRSGTSIGANLVEAKSSSSRLEFKRFYEIALKSGNESVYWLRLLFDASLINKKDFDSLKEELDEINKMVAKSVISLKKKL
ncbi:MAG: four helix bundle protein [Candidatus Nomurabacteria bacterium]|nr:MAG: four helix bundle protein [Candidatus Nomurabacteria bacterium]